MRIPVMALLVVLAFFESAGVAQNYKGPLIRRQRVRCWIDEEAKLHEPNGTILDSSLKGLISEAIREVWIEGEIEYKQSAITGFSPPTGEIRSHGRLLSTTTRRREGDLVIETSHERLQTRSVGLSLRPDGGRSFVGERQIVNEVTWRREGATQTAIQTLNNGKPELGLSMTMTELTPTTSQVVVIMEPQSIALEGGLGRLEIIRSVTTCLVEPIE